MWLLNWKQKKKVNLEELFSISICATSIPTGVALVYCAFDSNMLSKLTGVNIHIALAGLALLYIAIKTIKKY
ncbi:hypothetical protein GMMP15_500010 [Candidatus Magnetomoraceae bacterium gMMP-15]